MSKKITNTHTNKLFLDHSSGTAEFNSIRELSEDLERIDKMFDFVNALCDVLMDDPKSKMNKWATSKTEDHIRKINNSFLL